MIPQALTGHMIYQCRVPNMWPLGIAMWSPPKLTAEHFTFWRLLPRNRRTLLNPVMKIKPMVMISGPISVEVTSRTWLTCETLIKIWQLLPLIKWNSSIATCQRCGWSWCGRWAWDGRRGHPSIGMPRWSWIKQRASNGRNRTGYVPHLHITALRKKTLSISFSFFPFSLSKKYVQNEQQWNQCLKIVCRKITWNMDTGTSPILQKLLLEFHSKQVYGPKKRALHLSSLSSSQPCHSPAIWYHHSATTDVLHILKF